ncbi:hypothetical protein ANTRET_LOCUS6856 [Anthophora retusa]
MIGGFLDVMLVCVDETSNNNAGHINIPNATSVPVYVGSRKRGYELDQVLGHITDITRLLSQDGAMRMAVSLAVELSAVMFVGPHVEFNERSYQYENDLIGA